MSSDTKQATENWIRHIAAGGIDVFATAEFEHNVQVWSLAKRCQLAKFSTCLSFGGRRLAIVGGESPRVVAAAYEREGVALYDLTGRLVWQRKDLKKAQHLTSFCDPGGAFRIAVGFDEASMVILDPDTGKTIESLRGVREVWACDNDCLLSLSSKGVSLLGLRGYTTKWTQKLTSFGILDAAMSPYSVAFSEIGGSVRCFSHDGTELWQWKPEEETHALRVGWCQDLERWLLVTWPFQCGGEKLLLSLDSTGAQLAMYRLGQPAETEFLAGCKHLVTSDGDVLSTADGVSVWRFT
jgi:hypothetical protein